MRTEQYGMDRAQAETTYQRANSLYERARWDEALVLLDQLILLFPRNPNIQYSRALCLGRLGRLAEARDVCDLLTNALGDGRGAQFKARMAAEPPVRAAVKPEGKQTAEPPRGISSPATPVEPPRIHGFSRTETRPGVMDAAPAQPARREVLSRLVSCCMVPIRRVAGLLRQKRALVFACLVLGMIAALAAWFGFRRQEGSMAADSPAAQVSGLSEMLPNRPEETKRTPPEGEAVPAQVAAGVGRGDRRVTFPQDRSMGVLYVRDAGTLDEWKWLGDTCGDVVVPAGKELRLDATADGARDLSPLSALAPDALVELSLRSTPTTDEALSYITGLTGLECFYLGETAVTDAGLVHVEGLSRLKTLDLGMLPVTDAGLAYLEKLESLRELSLYGTRITDAGLAHLARLTNLEGLYLGGGMPVRGEGLAYLKGLGNLKRLNLWGTELEDDNVVHLGALTTLEKLNVGLTRITDIGLVHLVGLVALRELNLGQTQVTGAGLVHLAGLPALETLDLHGDPLSKEGVENLGKLTRLRDLNLAMVDLDEAALTGLKTALPNCAIVAE
jgi:hypothetical protein